MEVCSCILNTIVSHMYIHQAPLQFNFGVCIVLCNAHKCINANTLHLLYVCDYEELAMIFYKI